MKRAGARPVLGALVLFASVGFALCGSDEVSVTIVEPGRVSLKELVDQADVVALIEVRAGDSDHYEHAVYRSAVISAIKGVDAKETIYFGPFVGYSVGTQYLVALHRSGKVVGRAKSAEGPGFNPDAPLWEVMNQGYSAMPVQYTCDIPRCADGVLFAPEYVAMSDELAIYDSKCQCGATGKSWVKLPDLLRAMERAAAGLPNSTLEPPGEKPPAAQR